MEAHSKALNKSLQEIKFVLALGGKFPQSLLSKKNILGIEVIDELETAQAVRRCGLIQFLDLEIAFYILPACGRQVLIRLKI